MASPFCRISLPTSRDSFSPHFSARIDDALYTIEGKTKPFADSLETSIDVNIKDLNIPYYLAYVPMKMNFKVVSASVDTEARVSFIETKEKKPSLTITGNVSLKNIAVDDAKGKPLLQASAARCLHCPVGAPFEDHSPVEGVDPVARS